MVRNFYSHTKEAWKTSKRGKLTEPQQQRKREQRNQGAVEHIECPTRLDRVCEFGYKAKQGIIAVRVSVRKDGARKQRHKVGRCTKHQDINHINRRRSIPRVVEKHASRKHPNLRMLSSYGIGQDGPQKWQEVILVGSEHPAIQNDDDLNQTCDGTHEGRVFRGLTNAGKKNHSLQNRDKGTEHNRSFIRAGGGRGK